MNNKHDQIVDIAGICAIILTLFIVGFAVDANYGHKTLIYIIAFMVFLAVGLWMFRDLLKWKK